jgi:hypothetical protein
MFLNLNGFSLDKLLELAIQTILVALQILRMLAIELIPTAL